MKKNQVLGLVLLGGIALYYFMQQQRPVYTGPYQNVPPPPPQNSPNYQVWVNTILQTFGQVADLWKPGGPFYRQPVPPPINPTPGGIAGTGAASLLFLLPGV